MPTLTPPLDWPAIGTAHHFIDGLARTGRGAAMAIHAPAWGRHLVDLPGASPDDLDDAIAAARRTFDLGTWRRLGPEQRAACLKAAGDALLGRRDELARLVVFDNGKTLGEAHVDVFAAAAAFHQGAVFALRPSEEARGTERGVVRHVRREPIGVVAGITPFNATLSFCALKAAPALAAGNSVVLKPSERAPLLAIAVCDALASAGVPAGAVNLVHGGSAVAAALCADPRVDMISLTGGTDAGRSAMHAAAGTIKRLVLELGGKSAHIILADADLDQAITAAAGAIFKNAGQRCLSGSRLLVAREVADQVEARLAALAESLVLGDPFDPAVQGGALIDERAVAACEAFVATSRAEGLRVAAGGVRVDTLRPGTYFRPTVLTGANRDSYAAQEELFGPVLTIIRVADAEEAIAVANHSRFGLTGAVWSRDEQQALEVARSLRAGYVWVNTFGAMFGDIPFGGYKLSGLGREAGHEGFDAYTEAKSIMVDTTGGTTALRFT